MGHIALLSFVESSGTRFVQPEIKILLEVAVTKPNLRLVDFILQKCLTSLGDLGQFLVPAVNGNTELLERLLAADADLNAKAARLHGRTALQAAAAGRNLEAVERLLTANADVKPAESKDHHRVAQLLSSVAHSQ